MTHFGNPSYHDLLHILANVRELDRVEIECSRFDSFNAQDIARELLIADFAYSFIAYDPEPVCFMAFSWMTPAYVSGYSFATDGFNGIAFDLTRHIRNVVRPALKAAGIVRVEVKPLATRLDVGAWLELLGLKYEIELPRVGKNGENFCQYGGVV